MDIRVLQPDDAHLLHGVAPEVFDSPLEPQRASEFLRDARHHIVVAIDDGIVVGFASALDYVHPDKPSPELWINEVGVAATHRERGVGKAMLERLLDHARVLGCREAWVLTDRSNAPAMRLYRSVGGFESSADQVMYTFTIDKAAP